MLNIIISDWLYKEYPNNNEGFLTKKRAELVNKKFLETIARKIISEKDLIISNSIQRNNNRAISNIFSDIFESILGAIYIDGGLKNAKKFIYKHLLKNLDDLVTINTNYKGRLIEICHSLGYKEPIFKLIENNLENKLKFKVQLILDKKFYYGVGNTKKNAEVNAAKTALKKISNNT